MWGIFESSSSFAFFLTIFTGGLALLYDLSPQFRYHFKFVIYVIVVSTVSLICIPIFIFRPQNVTNVFHLINFFRLKKVSTLLGVKWELEGEDILAKEFPCIIICNHQTILDFLGMVELWPIMKKCAAVAKRDILFIPPFGFIAWLCGTIFIDRSNAAECKTKLNTSVEEIQENKTKLWIFPEGTRNKGASLMPFKKGAFHMAIQNKLPIVPIVISPYTFVNDEKKIFDSGRAILKVLPPIDTSSYGVDDVNKLTELAQNIMGAEYQRVYLLAQKSAAEESGRTSRHETICNSPERPKLD